MRTFRGSLGLFTSMSEMMDVTTVASVLLSTPNTTTQTGTTSSFGSTQRVTKHEFTSTGSCITRVRSNSQLAKLMKLTSLQETVKRTSTSSVSMTDHCQML